MKKITLTGQEYVAIVRNKKKIIMAFSRLELRLYFDIMELLYQSKNKPFITIDDNSDTKVGKRTRRKIAKVKFTEIGFLKPTEIKNQYRVSEKFMFYGIEQETVKFTENKTIKNQ